MGREEQIINERLRKLKELKQQGINPYPAKYDVKHHSLDWQEKNKKIKNEKTTGIKKYKLAPKSAEGYRHYPRS